ncbi:G-protein coupled receptor 157-like [Mytilus edulis]|uniref:G-protein coupled receptor 157-like n=1 Tax=Mytilus edulis TaxID=6550 RepID=UPI0039F0A41C
MDFTERYKYRSCIAKESQYVIREKLKDTKKSVLFTTQVFLHEFITTTSMVLNSNETVALVSSSVNGTSISSDGLDWPYIILTAIVSSLSIFGGLGITFIYVLYKDLRTPGRRLLVYLSLMDALTAFGNILGVIWLIHRDSPVIHKSMAYCKIQSGMTIYSSISSFSWTVVMGLCLVFSIVRSSPSFASKYMKLFHIISWLLPATITIIALSTNVLGYDTTLDQPSWCWIDPRVPHALFWQFFTGKFWEICTYIATIVLYSMVKVFLWRKSKTTLTKAKKTRKAALQEANLKLTFVPVVFIVFRFWGTLRFLLGFFAHDYASSGDSRWIAILQGIGDSIQGFANFVFYVCLTEQVRTRIFSTIQCKKSETAHTMFSETGPSHSRVGTVQTENCNNSIRPQ